MESIHVLCARFSALLLILLFSSAVYAGSPKVEVCHVPSGDSDNFHTIKINENALGAHLGHGDLAGPCNAICAQLCDDGNACTVDDVGDCETNGCPVVSLPVDCSDGNLCTDDVCNPSSGCSNPVAVTCEPTNLCVTSACDPIFGMCEETAKTCDEGESCNIDNGMCEPDGPVANICPCFGGFTTEDKTAALKSEGATVMCGTFTGLPGLVGVFFESGELACSGPACIDEQAAPSCGGIGTPFASIADDENAACQALIMDICPDPVSGGPSSSSSSSQAPLVKPFISN